MMSVQVYIVENSSDIMKIFKTYAFIIGSVMRGNKIWVVIAKFNNCLVLY